MLFTVENTALGRRVFRQIADTCLYSTVFDMIPAALVRANDQRGVKHDLGHDLQQISEVEFFVLHVVDVSTN